MSRTPTSQPVAITGVGAIGAFGNGLDALDNSLRNERDGLRELTLWASDLDHFPVGQYPGELERDLDAIPALTPRTRKRLSRSDQLALVATREAVEQSGLRDLTRAGAYIGESVCGTLHSEALYIEARRRAAENKSDKLNLTKMFTHEGANTLDRLAELYDLAGPTLSFMTACSSAANAIGLAARQVHSGRCDVMIAGGADSLSRIALNGFCSLKVVSPDGPRPFDADRKGMMVGEGAGMLVLESAEHAKARGAEILAWLTGYGHSCDAHHLTAPHPEGKGAITSMTLALESAGIDADEIGYINAHGTGTQDNDTTESRAIAQVFGDKGVPVSSSKRFFGHTLAAAGGIESVTSVWALTKGLLPSNLGLQGEIEDARVDVIRQTREATGLRHVLSNSFGFGGNNAALVFTGA